MRPNYRLNPNHDISAAITRIYKQINSIERGCTALSNHVVKTQPSKAAKPVLKLVK